MTRIASSSLGRNSLNRSTENLRLSSSPANHKLKDEYKNNSILNRIVADDADLAAYFYHESNANTTFQPANGVRTLSAQMGPCGWGGAGPSAFAQTMSSMMQQRSMMPAQCQQKIFQHPQQPNLQAMNPAAAFQMQRLGSGNGSAGPYKARVMAPARPAAAECLLPLLLPLTTHNKCLVLRLKTR